MSDPEGQLEPSGIFDAERFVTTPCTNGEPHDWTGPTTTGGDSIAALTKCARCGVYRVKAVNL